MPSLIINCMMEHFVVEELKATEVKGKKCSVLSMPIVKVEVVQRLYGLYKIFGLWYNRRYRQIALDSSRC